MPAKSKNVKHLNDVLKIAHKPNKDKIRHVIFTYEKGNINNFKTALNAVVALAVPSASTPKVSELYQQAMSWYPCNSDYKAEAELHLKILLFTHVPQGKRKGTAKDRKELSEEEKQKEEANNKLDKGDKKKFARYLTKKYPDHRRFWAGYLDVSMGSDNFFPDVKDKLITRKQKQQWKGLYDICMTDSSFSGRESSAPGYLEGMMLLSYALKPAI